MNRRLPHFPELPMPSPRATLVEVPDDRPLAIHAMTVPDSIWARDPWGAQESAAVSPRAGKPVAMTIAGRRLSWGPQSGTMHLIRAET